jgi:purine-binding chemotaxis protein CheW
MTVLHAGFEERLAELRRVFDGSFAVPARLGVTEGELFLAVRTSAGRFAIRLTDVLEVHECRKVVPLPGSPPGLLGISGIRGRLYAVHALSSLLGPSAPGERHRWLLIAGSEAPIALSVEAIEACLEVRADELRAIEPAAAGHGAHVRELLVRDGEARGVLDVAAIVARALQRAQEAGGDRR